MLCNLVIYKGFWTQNFVSKLEGMAMVVPVLHHPPAVISFARNFKDFFPNVSEYAHFKNYLSGLMGAERKNYSQIASTMVNSADESNISRFMKNPLWSGQAINDHRVLLMQERTQRKEPSATGCLVLDDTLDEHVGNLFDHIATHYDHSDNSYKLAQNPVTSHFVKGLISFPIDFRMYRTYDEVTKWPEHFAKHFPAIPIPPTSKERNKLKKKYEQQLLDVDPAFARKHHGFKTKLTLAVELINDAIRRELDVSVVLFDAWYLAPEVVEAIEQAKKAWVSILKKNRKLETQSLHIDDTDGKRLEFEDSEIKMEELLPLIPTRAYHTLTIDQETTYYACTFTARIPTLGKVRLVICYDKAPGEGRCAVLVTGQLNWEAKKIVTTYANRWSIEVFYKDAKQTLGFSDYQCRSETAIEKHWYLVFCAYSLLKLSVLSAPLYENWERHLKTIGVALRRPVRSVIEPWILACHRFLAGGRNPQQVFNLLFT